MIAPFNVPTILAIRAIAPALALGNAVILKPDPRTVVTGGVTIARVFEEAGLPAGVLQMLPGRLLTPDAIDFVNQAATADNRKLLERMPRRLTPLEDGLRTYLTLDGE